jgi:hypothetical protein
MIEEPQVLKPYHRAEAISIEVAARIAGRSVRTLREWCARYDIGRRICGQWALSRVALAMHLDGDRGALKAYLEGDRSSPAIAAYFKRCGVPLPGRRFDTEERQLSGANARAETEAA